VFTVLDLVKIVLVPGFHVLFVEEKETITFATKQNALNAKEQEKAAIFCLALFAVV
jgi:hypothetical protein